MAKRKGKGDEGLASSPKPRGGQTLYTQEIADQICQLLSMGKTLTSICKTVPGLPAAPTVIAWAQDKDSPFAEQYARARTIGYQVMGDHILDIADEDEDAQKARLKVETRKWLLSKALPKIYGDKVAVTDADGGNLVVKFIT